MVEIPSITDGSENLLEAQIEYAVGDKAKNTEVEILAGDMVWVDFIDDDHRYPIITGYRNPRVGNSVDTRHIHHKNIDIAADSALTLSGGSIGLTGDTTITGETTVHGDTGFIGEVSVVGGATIEGDVTIGGNLVVGGTITPSSWDED